MYLTQLFTRSIHGFYRYCLHLQFTCNYCCYFHVNKEAKLLLLLTHFIYIILWTIFNPLYALLLLFTVLLQR